MGDEVDFDSDALKQGGRTAPMSHQDAFDAWADSTVGISKRHRIEEGAAGHEEQVREQKLNEKSRKKYEVIWDRWLKYVGATRWYEANGTDLKNFLHNGLTPSKTVGSGNGDTVEARRAERAARARPGSASSVTKKRYASVIMDVYKRPDIMAGVRAEDRWGNEAKDVPKTEDMQSSILTPVQREALVAQLREGRSSEDPTAVRDSALCSLILMEGLSSGEVIEAKNSWIQMGNGTSQARIKVAAVGETRGKAQHRWLDLSDESVAALAAWSSSRRKLAPGRTKGGPDSRLFIPAPERKSVKGDRLTTAIVHKICSRETRKALESLGSGHTSAHEGPTVLRNTRIMQWMQEAASMAQPDFEGVRQKAGLARARSLRRFVLHDPRMLEAWNSVYRSVANEGRQEEIELKGEEEE